MALTEEEQFRFDLTGFLVRPAILSADEVAAITEHVDRLMHHREDLPPHLRSSISGPAEILIDHPKVIDVLHDVIGPDIRLDGSFAVWRHRGHDGGQPLHQGGAQGDHVFGYQVHNGRIFAGVVRVVFELTDVNEDDGATQFLIGSHKSNFPVPPEHMPLDGPGRSPFLTSYSCPAGSAIFFTENLMHAGAPWHRESPRVAVLNAYGHICTRWHRQMLPPEAVAALSPERRAYLREPWWLAFNEQGAYFNSTDRYVAEAPPAAVPVPSGVNGAP